MWFCHSTPINTSYNNRGQYTRKKFKYSLLDNYIMILLLLLLELDPRNDEDDDLR
jgi:hypothetical protein